MRFDKADPSLETYLGTEPLLNNLKRVSINSGTEAALAVVPVDSDGNQLSTPTSIGDGRKVVTTAGTRVQLSASSVPCKRVTICAETDNTGYIVVGGSSVVASLATRQGVPLWSGDSITVDISNLNLVYLDSTVNGDGVTYIYEA